MRNAQNRRARLSCSTVLLWSLVFWAFSPSSGSAQPPAAAPPAPPSTSVLVTDERLANDARLQRKVTLDETGIPLEELLQRFSGAGLTLSCGRSCQEQKLHLRLKERPLRTLMEALAELLPGEWKPIEGGYRLDMDLKAVARRERWWRLFLSEQERAFAAQRAFVLQKMRATPTLQAPYNDLEQKRRDPAAFEEARKQRAAAGAQMFAGDTFFHQLPANLQERIANQILSAPFYSAGMAVTSGKSDEGTVVIPVTDLPPSAQALARERGSSFLAKSGSQVPWENAFLRFSNNGYAVSPSVVLPNGTYTDLMLGLSVDYAPDAFALTLDQDRLADEVDRLGRAAPLPWRQLAAYQKSRVWENDRPADFQKTPAKPRNSETLRLLADRSGIEFVADYYSLPSRLMTPEEQDRGPLKQPLKDEMDLRAAAQDTSWKQQTNNLYLFRSNRWYRDDYLEVPDALLKRWLAQRTPLRPMNGGGAFAAAGDRSAASGARERIKKQMDWEAEAVTALTPWQVANGLRWFVPEERHETTEDKRPRRAFCPFVFEAQRLVRQYQTARFYASLSPAARAALIENRLPLGSLSMAQRQQAMYLRPVLALLAEGKKPDSLLLGLQPYTQPILAFHGLGPDMGGDAKSIGWPDMRLTLTSSPEPEGPGG